MPKTGAKETKWLFFLIIVSNFCYEGINALAASFSSGAVLSVGISAIIALCAVFVINRFAGEKDMGDIIGSAFGHKGQKILTLIIFAVTLLYCADRMNSYANAVNKFMLPQTPLRIIVAVMTVAAFSVALLKLEALTRYSLAASFVFICFIALLFASVAGEADCTNLFPVFGKMQISDLFKPLHFYSVIIYFYFISSFVSGTKKSAIPIWAVLLSAVVGIAILFVYTLCVPYPVNREFSYPLYRIASLANSSVVFQRLDGIVFVIWIFLGFIFSGSILLFSTMLFADTFDLADTAGVCPAIALLAFALSLSVPVPRRFINTAISLIGFVVLPLGAGVSWFKEK